MTEQEGTKTRYFAPKKPLADENPLHFDVLLSLYKLLTGSKLDCPRYGSHWEQIGFQGNDPATDLRGNTLPTAEILSGKNARAWVSMVLYSKR